MQNILKKYPWISYNIDLAKMPYSFWFELGQCVSKCDHIKQIPLLPEVWGELHLIYLAKGVAATTAIEGNTLGEKKALDIIKGKATTGDSEQYQRKEIENIIDACNKIASALSKGKDIKINVETLCGFNKIILSGDVSIAEGAVPGEIRKHSVVVGNIYKAPDAQDVIFLLTKFCDWLDKFGNDIEVKSSIDKQSIAIIKAIAAHLYLIWIHPFGDGNGRLARLIEFAILLKSGVPSIAAHLLSNHYNSTRPLYYQNLQKAQSDHLAFFQYAVKGFQDNLKATIQTIIEQVMSLSWQQYVYEKFREMPSEPAKRQRDVLLEISAKCFDKKEALSFDEVKSVVGKVYVKYNKTEKSFTRDMNFLLKNDFLERTDTGITPKLAPIFERLPFSK